MPDNNGAKEYASAAVCFCQPAGGVVPQVWRAGGAPRAKSKDARTTSSTMPISDSCLGAYTCQGAMSAARSLPRHAAAQSWLGPPPASIAPGLHGLPSATAGATSAPDHPAKVVCPVGAGEHRWLLSATWLDTCESESAQWPPCCRLGDAAPSLRAFLRAFTALGSTAVPNKVLLWLAVHLVFLATTKMYMRS